MKLFGLEFGSTKTKPIVIRQDEVEGSRPIEIKKIKPVNAPVLSYRSSVTQRGNFEPSEWNLNEIGRVEDVESYVRQSFRKKCGLMFKEGWEFIGPNPTTIRYLQERLKQAEAATGMPIKLLLRETAMDLIKYSNAYWYKVRSLKQSGGKRRELPSGRVVNPVAGYFKIPPEMVEIKRNKNGKVLKYRQRSPEGRIQEYEPINVVHFYFDRKSGFATGTPALIPVMDDIRALRRIEENIELLVYQHLFPLFHYKVGNENAPAEIYPDGTNEVDIVRQEVQFMPSEGSIVTPERHEITALGAEGRAIRAEGYLTHFKKRVFSGLGLSAVDFGEGETANRATADNMSRALVDDVKAMQREFETFIDEFLLKELLLESTFSFDVLAKENMVHLKFHEVDLDAKIKVENHEMTLYQGFLATEDETRRAMGREPITDDERDNTFWEIVKKPQAIIQSLDEAFIQEEAVGSAGIDSEEAEQSKANKRRMAEEERLAKAKGKPTTKASGAERKAKAKNQPSNQHGKSQGPTKRKSSLVTDNVINQYYQMLKSDTIEAAKAKKYDKLWLKSHAFAAVAKAEEKFIRELKNELRKGVRETGVKPYTIELDFAFTIVRDRAHLYITRIIERLFELTESRLHGQIDELKTEEIITKLIAIFDALEFRTDLVYNAELRKAYTLGLAIGFKAAGFTQAQLDVEGTACEECKNNQDLTFDLEYITIDELPGLHPNCHCTIKPIHNNSEDFIQQDLTAKEERCVIRVKKQLRSKFPARSAEAIKVSAIKICRAAINKTDEEVDGMVEKFTEEDFNV
jgi:hypothetical protein